MRDTPVSGQQATLTLITLGIIEYMKVKGELPRSFSTRHFQTAHNNHRISSIVNIREVVNNTIAGNMFKLRPLRINVARIIF